MAELIGLASSVGPLLAPLLAVVWVRLGRVEREVDAGREDRHSQAVAVARLAEAVEGLKNAVDRMNAGALR